MPRYRVDGNGACYIGYSMEIEADDKVEAAHKAEEFWKENLAFVRVHKPKQRPPISEPELYDWEILDNIEIDACIVELLPDEETPE